MLYFLTLTRLVFEVAFYVFIRGICKQFVDGLIGLNCVWYKICNIFFFCIFQKSFFNFIIFFFINFVVWHIHSEGCVVDWLIYLVMCFNIFCVLTKTHLLFFCCFSNKFVLFLHLFKFGVLIYKKSHEFSRDAHTQQYKKGKRWRKERI